MGVTVIGSAYCVLNLTNTFGFNVIEGTIVIGAAVKVGVIVRGSMV